MMANLSLAHASSEKHKAELVTNGTRLATVDEAGNTKLHESLPSEQTGCALLANLLVTRGNLIKFYSETCDES